MENTLEQVFVEMEKLKRQIDEPGKPERIKEKPVKSKEPKGSEVEGLKNELT